MGASLISLHRNSTNSIGQKLTDKLVLVLPLSCLLWGIGSVSLISTAVSEEKPGFQSSETTTLTHPSLQDLLKLQKPESEDTAAATEQVDFNSYRLGPGDAIAISVSPRSKDLSVNATLDWQGNVSVPLVGIVGLKDLTVAQAQEKIKSGLNEYIVNPQVGIVLGTARAVKVMVMGEVAKPGFYALQDPRLPVALVEAGGTTRFADLRAVQVQRSSGDGPTVEQSVDLFTPLKEGSNLPDLRLMDGDVIKIAALTPETAKDYDRELFAKSNVGQPKITVRVLDHSSGVSRLQLENGSDFLDALTSIKPEIERVNLKKVLLIRFDPKQGKAVTRTINAKEALKGDQAQNPVLEHNDVIVIDRTWIAKLNYTLNQITQPFKDTLGFLLFFDSAQNGLSKAFGSEQNQKK